MVSRHFSASSRSLYGQRRSPAATLFRRRREDVVRGSKRPWRVGICRLADARRTDVEPALPVAILEGSRASAPEWWTVVSRHFSASSRSLYGQRRSPAATLFWRRREDVVRGSKRPWRVGICRLAAARRTDVEPALPAASLEGSRASAQEWWTVVSQHFSASSRSLYGQRRSPAATLFRGEARMLCPGLQAVVACWHLPACCGAPY